MTKMTDQINPYKELKKRICMNIYQAAEGKKKQVVILIQTLAWDF